jgi:hypothetical protein
MMEPVARRLLEQTRNLHSRYLAAPAACTAVGSLFVSWSEISKEIGRAGSFTDADSRLLDTTGREWRAAIEALREHADAPLPADAL